MISVLVAGGVAMVVALLATPLFINFLVNRQYGQFIRQDGPTAHYTKRGTPTMGGVVIIGATLIGFGVAALVTGNLPSASALLVLFLMTGLGVVGFLDDYIKISRQRSLGLSARWKIVGQGFVGITFAVLALQFPDATLRTPASTSISFIRDTGLDLAFAGATIGAILFVIWANFLITAWSNAVNLTDGLDGLATGSSLIVFGAYVIVCVWQFNQRCGLAENLKCYATRDPLDMAVVAAAVTGACFGFLWWNASPAKIFMGDTGSLALGGMLAGLSVTTRTELLMVVIGALFVAEAASVVIQVAVFRSSRRRVFRMAPFHHHFELGGWAETTVIIRFWLLAAIASAVGMALFYSEYLAAIGD